MPKKTKLVPPAPESLPVAAPAAVPPAETGTTRETRRTPARDAKPPRNHRELAQAIFEECDPVVVGRELLGPNGERSNSVKARVWETLVDFLFGKQPAGGGASSGPNVRIVWDLPAPPHERDKS